MVVATVNYRRTVTEEELTEVPTNGVLPRELASPVLAILDKALLPTAVNAVEEEKSTLSPCAPHSRAIREMDVIQPSNLVKMETAAKIVAKIM